ncbi:fido domain-containing protein, partial [Lenzites betulinus]
CPPVRVEDELFKICEMAQKFILQGRMSPFALAAWLHLALARCHPFDDGNGRTTRLIASVPLLMHGYPPIAVSLAERSSYFDAINQAYFSDFRPLVKCFVKGMQEGIDMARALNQSA